MEVSGGPSGVKAFIDDSDDDDDDDITLVKNIIIMIYHLLPLILIFLQGFIVGRNQYKKKKT